MRGFQALAGFIAMCAVGSYLWGHHLLAALLGWVAFPLAILADFIVERRRKHGE